MLDRIVSCALISLGLAAGAPAPSNVLAKTSLPTPRQVEDVSAHVAPQATTTYEDLLRLVFPTMHDDETGTTLLGPTAVAIRTIDADSAPAVLVKVSRLESMSAVWLADGAAMRLVLLIEVQAEDANSLTPYGGEADLLAVFDVGPTSRLVDVMDAKTDRFTGFSERQPVVALGPKAYGCVVYSEHYNSSQSYSRGTVLQIHRGEIRVVADIALFSWRDGSKEVDETATFRARPRAGSPCADLIVTVVRAIHPLGETGDRLAARSIRRYVGIFRWRRDARGYAAAGGTLDRLDRLNRTER
jgi:hypothetical protein